MEPYVLRPEQAAKALQTSKANILNQLKSGEIPAYKDGSEWKIPVESLQRHINERAESEAKNRREA